MAFPATTMGMLARSRAILIGGWTLSRAIVNRRRLLGQLGQLDDRMLRDIGLSRHDVISVAAEPLFRDPSISLRRFAEERRAASRAAGRERASFHALVRNWVDERHAA